MQRQKVSNLHRISHTVILGEANRQDHLLARQHVRPPPKDLCHEIAIAVL
jgi:hypothetical protein